MSRIPPHDLPAEEALLGACLLSNPAIEAAMSALTPADFYSPLNQRVFDAMCVLHTAGERADQVTLAGMIDDEAADIVYLSSLMMETPSVSGVLQYASLILEASKLRSLILIGANLVDAGYRGDPPAEVARTTSLELGDSELLRRRTDANIQGFYEDIGTLDPGGNRDEHQPWLSEGVLRRGQRLLVVAKAGLGKSFLLRQIAWTSQNGVHMWTGQPTERARPALIVELEAGEWDITDSTRALAVSLSRSLDCNIGDVQRPALLHRAGGLNLRSPEGLAALEAVIQRVQPEVVCMGPVKYMSQILPGENYENAALALHAILNTLIARYGCAIAMEAHFSRGDHGSPGGSERWVDWPDVGFALHPPENDVSNRIVAGGVGTEIDVKPFRVPRDAGIWLPDTLIRGAAHRLPWSADDGSDPMHLGSSVFATRYGGQPASSYVAHPQGSFSNDDF